MWDCRPYSDLYEELDYDYYEIDEGLRRPMEFAHNNMKAFMYDVEMQGAGYAWCTFDFTDPVAGRFKFDLTVRTWGRCQDQELKFLVWMPGDRLSSIRQMPATDGRRKAILLDGCALSWEEAVDRVRTAMHTAAGSGA